MVLCCLSLTFGKRNRWWQRTFFLLSCSTLSPPSFSLTHTLKNTRTHKYIPLSHHHTHSLTLLYTRTTSLTHSTSVYKKQRECQMRSRIWISRCKISLLPNYKDCSTWKGFQFQGKKIQEGEESWPGPEVEKTEWHVIEDIRSRRALLLSMPRVRI